MSAKFLGPFVSYEGYVPSDTSFDSYRTYANFSNFMEIYQNSENAEEIIMYRHLYKGESPSGSFTGFSLEFYPTGGEGDVLADSDYGFTKFLNRNVSNVLTSSPEQVVIKPEYPQSLAAVSQQTYCFPF